MDTHDETRAGDDGLVDSLADGSGRPEDDFVAPLGVDFGTAVAFQSGETTGLILGGVPPAPDAESRGPPGAPRSREFSTPPTEAVVDELETLGMADEVFDVLAVQTIPQEPVETDLTDHVDAEHIVGPHPVGFDVADRPEDDPLAESFPGRRVYRRAAIRSSGSMTETEADEARRRHMLDAPDSGAVRLFYLSPSQSFSEASLSERLPDGYRTPPGHRPPERADPTDARGATAEEAARYTSLAVELDGSFGNVLVAGPGGSEVVDAALETRRTVSGLGDTSNLDGVVGSPRMLDAPTKMVQGHLESTRPAAVHLTGDVSTTGVLRDADRKLLNTYADRLTTAGNGPFSDGENETTVWRRADLVSEATTRSQESPPSEGEEPPDEGGEPRERGAG